MLEGLAADTRVIIYLMAGIGVLGVLAKIINQLTLYRLVRAAGNMPKSTHRLIKLVRAKYEHACMIHDSVENIDAFVEKYIYEYRGFLFRIHTWRQIEVLSVWFAGILAALGASAHYFSFGLTETVYQYIAAGIAEMVFLSVIMRLSDEPYKINAVKMYMVDYLENICAFRLKRQNQRERESIDVIASENEGKSRFQPVASAKSDAKRGNASRELREDLTGEAQGTVVSHTSQAAQTADASRAGSDRLRAAEARREIQANGDTGTAAKGKREEGLPINIEGEPRAAESGSAAGQAPQGAAAENGTDNDRTALREEAIRQILEEFLA